jgi:8-oxo-dGTP pyrophosphatase MutT (NUDIX family)
MISKERLHAVSIVLINEQKQILGVSRKYDHDDMGIVGGKVDPDDNFDIMAAAIRETKEETGLDIFDLELIYATFVGNRMQWTFLAKYSGEIHTDEPHVVKWIDKETLLKGSFREYNNEVLTSLNQMGITVN